MCPTSFRFNFGFGHYFRPFERLRLDQRRELGGRAPAISVALLQNRLLRPGSKSAWLPTPFNRVTSAAGRLWAR